MNDTEKLWLKDAVVACNSATAQTVTILLIRRQDANDEADMVVTNASSADMVRALYAEGLSGKEDDE